MKRTISILLLLYKRNASASFISFTAKSSRVGIWTEQNRNNNNCVKARLCSSDKNSLQLGDNTARPLALMKGVTTAWKPNVTCSVACSLSTNRRRLDQWRADDRSKNLFISFKTVTNCIFYSAAQNVQDQRPTANLRNTVWKPHVAWSVAWWLMAVINICYHIPRR